MNGGIICWWFISNFLWFICHLVVYANYLFVFRGKRWDEALERPDLDYSEIFDQSVGQIPGTELPNLKSYFLDF